MSKEFRICSCGRIHFYDSDLVNKAIDENKDLLLICGGCGRATHIGADETPNFYDDTGDTCYMMYSFDLKDDTIIDAESFKGDEKNVGIYKVLYSIGKKVFMKTGYSANCYGPNGFEDMRYPDFWQIERTNITVAEILAWVDKFRQDRFTVNMNQLVRDLSDEELSILHKSAYIKQFDWSQTRLGPQNF